MSNKCPMCNTAEDEHAEVLRLLKKFDDNRPMAEFARKVLGDIAKPNGPNALTIEASDLYRKLKTQ